MIVGTVISTGEGCFQWTIQDFLPHVWRKDIRLDSPSFNFSGAFCHLNLFFSGTDRYLKLNFWHNVYSTLSGLNVKLGMRTGRRGKREYLGGVTDGFGEFGTHAWIPCSKFLKRSCEILRDGSLTVFCELSRLGTEESASVLQGNLPITGYEKFAVESEDSERDSGEEVTDFECKTLKKMQRDLGNLLISGEDSDVTIEVEGKKFPAHRNILRTRAPVFKYMFSHEIVEKQNGVVVIDDCDPVTFKDFLVYLYTGSIRRISDENVFRLYAASDKYGVEELKEACVTYMKNNVSVGTFCDVITLALRHTETELIDSATVFFSANITQIIKTAKWQKFLCEDMTAGNELLIKALSNGKKCLYRDYC